MRVQLIAKREPGTTGTARYTRDLFQGLNDAGLNAQLTFPGRALIPAPVQNGLKRFRLDVEAFFSSYPLQASLDSATIYHLTSQMLATLLLFQRFPQPVVVTVLDIIPYLVRHRSELNTFRHPAEAMFYRLALNGLRRADALIAISEYTRQTLVEALGLPGERIHVVYPGIDRRQFYSRPVPDAFRLRYGLHCDQRYLLFVGSEDPRKNLPTLIRAFARVKRQRPDTKLLKVGPAQFARERAKLLSLVDALGLQHDVRFFNYISDEDLPLFYNVADVLVMPSLYEGFGFPVAEAMACGTPVVCARAGSLPEVVGDAGIQVDPCDVDSLVSALLAVLEDPDQQLRLRQAGHRQADRFALPRSVCAIQELYAKTSNVEHAAFRPNRSRAGGA